MDDDKIIKKYWENIKDKNILEEFDRIIDSSFTLIDVGLNFDYVRIIDKYKDNKEFEIKFLKETPNYNIYDDYYRTIQNYSPDILKYIYIVNIHISYNSMAETNPNIFNIIRQCQQYKKGLIKKSDIKLIYKEKDIKINTEKETIGSTKNIQIGGTNNTINNNTINNVNIIYNKLYGSDNTQGLYDSFQYIVNKLWKSDEVHLITNILQKNVMAEFLKNKYIVLTKDSEEIVDINFFKPCKYEVIDNDKNIKIYNCGDHIQNNYQSFLNYEDSIKYSYMIESGKHYKRSNIENLLDKYYDKCKISKYNKCMSVKLFYDELRNNATDLHLFNSIINYKTRTGFTNNLKKFLKENNCKYESKLGKNGSVVLDSTSKEPLIFLK